MGENDPCTIYTCCAVNVIDECCTKYTCVPGDCEYVKCPDTVPACKYYEDLKTVQYDECCCTYECECNPSKCIDLYECPCPEGFIRAVVDTSCCCPVERCIPCEYTTTTKSTITPGTKTPVTHITKTHTPYTCPPTNDPCYDKDGNERQYGDCWSPEACTYCQCYADGQVRCTKTECAPMKTCMKGQERCVERTADGCCNVAFCRDIKCYGVVCDFKPPQCEYYEDCVAQQVSECCCSYSCVCNKSKCCDLGEAECPEGYEQVVTAHECCPVAKCIPCEYTTKTPVTHITGTPGTHPTTTKTPPTTTPCITITTTTEPPVCVDHEGKPRCYGEQWSVSECESCCCIAAGNVQCSKQECPVEKCAKGTFQCGTYSVDKCCTAPLCSKIPEEKCPECPEYECPTCECYEDLISTPIDADCCCYKYSCECNKDKCFHLGEETCPAGYRRTVVDTDACCPVARCCSVTVTPDVTATTPCTTTKTVTKTPVTHVTPLTPCIVCVDITGCERAYGESWTFENDPCTVYTCCAVNDIRATKRECGYKRVACKATECERVHKIDECCTKYTCVPGDCEYVECPDVVPECKYYEDLNTVQYSKCCCS